MPWLLLLQSFGSRAHGLHYLGHMVLVAPRHVESSQPRDRTPVPCTGRWILDHWTTRRVPRVCLNLCRRAHPRVCAYALSHVRLRPHGSSLHGIFQGRILEQCTLSSSGIFPIQGSNPQLLTLLHGEMSSLTAEPPGTPTHMTTDT